MPAIKVSRTSTMPPGSNAGGLVPTKNQRLIFDELVELLHPYEKMLKVKAKTSSRYELMTAPVLINKAIHKVKNQHEGVLFAGVSILKKNKVGFYFFPLNINPSLVKVLEGTSLVQFRKGGTVFHLAELSDQKKEEIKLLLESGIVYYKEILWIKN